MTLAFDLAGIIVLGIGGAFAVAISMAQVFAPSVSANTASAPSFNTVYCSNCGASNPSGATYCGQCGKMLNP